jgi:hypothetical protein
VSDFEIRGARPDDLSDIGDVTVDAYRRDGFLGTTPSGLRRQAPGCRSRAEHAELLAAVDQNGAVLGSVTVVQPGTRFSEISAKVSSNSGCSPWRPRPGGVGSAPH